MKHPSSYTLMGHLKDEQGLTEYIDPNHEAQGASDAPKVVYQGRQKRLFNEASRYGESATLTHLRHIVHNVKF